MSSAPKTAVGLMLRAMARRENEEFQHYREHMNEDEEEQRRLSPLLYQIFRHAVELKFAEGAPVEQIRTFLTQPRLLMWPDKGFSTSKAEALIRSALGERGLVSGITTGEATTLRVETFTYLVEDMRLSDQDLDLLISRSEQWLEAHGKL